MTVAERAQLDILACMPARVFWKDRDSRYLGCNTAFAAHLGLTPADVVGKLDTELAPPAEAARYRADDLAVMESGAPRVGYDEPRTFPDGVVHVIRTTKVPLRDAEDRVVGVLGYFDDVTAMHAAEAHARASEARHRAFLEQSPLATQIVGRDGRTRAVNAAWERLFGTPFAALAGYDLRSDPQLERQGLLAVIDRAFEGETVRVAESEYDTAATPSVPGGDRKVWLRSVVYGVRGPEGSVDEIVIVHEDLTAGRLADERARQSTERFARVVEKASEGVSICRAVDRPPFVEFTAWNDRMTAITGYTMEEINRLGWYQTMYPDPEVQARAAARMERMRTGDDLSGEEWVVTTRSGEQRTLLISTATITLEDGSAAVLALMHDATEQRRGAAERERLRAELEAAKRLESIGRLAGGIAHDHNNMLGVILGCATGALEALEPGHPARDDLEELLDAARRSAELTRQLLGFARRQPAVPSTFALSERLDTAGKMLSRLVREDIRLEIAAGTDVPCVHIDPAQLDQILVNLVANARDAIRGAGVIRVETATRTVRAGDVEARTVAPGEYVALVVRDDGAGMAPDVVLHAFEPFFTTKGVGAGTGLGLATVHGIVRQNGGDAWIKSAPARGTEVTILLPAHAPPPPRVEAPQRAPSRGGREAILLVEDEPAVLRLVERMLVRLGYEVRSAPSPAEALHLARRAETPIDLLVTDVMLPEMSGRALADALAELRPGLRRVFMSGYPADELASQGLLAPGTVFLQKPFTADALAARVRDALEQPSAP